MKNIYLLLSLLLVSNIAFSQKKPLLYDDWHVTVTSFAEKFQSKNPILPKFVPVGATWNHRIITYFFHNGTADINADDEREAVRGAFALWAHATDLYFLEVCSASDADIEISWGTGNHGDAVPFDGVNGVLAHTYFPPPLGNPLPGDMHFDDDETWTMATRADGTQPIDLFTVAAHEIGHGLGLDHTSVSGSLMNTTYTSSHRFLGTDDFTGITSLYGYSRANVPISGTCSYLLNRIIFYIWRTIGSICFLVYK